MQHFVVSMLVGGARSFSLVRAECLASVRLAASGVCATKFVGRSREYHTVSVPRRVSSMKNMELFPMRRQEYYMTFSMGSPNPVSRW